MIEQLAFRIDMNVDPLWCAWFSGLFDGEGYFDIHISKTTMGIDISLGIGMRADEAKGLKEIQDTLRCGLLVPREAYKRSKPKITWKVHRIGDIVNIIIPLLDQYPLRMKKARDYAYWREAAQIIRVDGHLNGHRDRVLELKRLMEEGRKYQPPEEA